jgi:hypothetical protein
LRVEIGLWAFIRAKLSGSDESEVYHVVFLQNPFQSSHITYFHAVFVTGTNTTRLGFKGYQSFSKYYWGPINSHFKIRFFNTKLCVDIFCAFSLAAEFFALSQPEGRESEDSARQNKFDH